MSTNTQEALKWADTSNERLRLMGADQLDMALEVVCVESMNLMHEADAALKKAQWQARRAGIPSLATERAMSHVVALMNEANRLQFHASRISLAASTVRQLERAERVAL